MTIKECLAQLSTEDLAYAKEYYRQLAKLPEYGSFDIIGHSDQITKHCENKQFIVATFYSSGNVICYYV